MPRIYVEYAGLRRIGGNCKAISSKVNTIQSDFQNTVRQLDWDIKYEADINNIANQIARKLDNYTKILEQYQRFIDESYKTYVKMDEYESSIELSKASKGVWETFKDELTENYGWKEILKGSGYIGAIYGLINGLKNGKTWKDFAKSGIDIYQFLSGAAVTYKNYKKIGNVVGGKKAMSWYIKNITGVKCLGRASTAQNPILRFKNNLTNKTSPFNAQIKNVIDNFTGKNGVGKTVASWGAVAVNGALNWFGNKEEQTASNGNMSDGRVVAETISETAIDTALTYGAGIVVGAAVTAVIGPVAAPGIVVTAVSGLAVAGINAGVKAVTGKTTTEWISDTMLDAAETLVKTKWKQVETVSKSVGNWFDKLAFT